MDGGVRAAARSHCHPPAAEREPHSRKPTPTVGARLLRAKLVAREAEDGEALAAVLGEQALQLGVLFFCVFCCFVVW